LRCRNPYLLFAAALTACGADTRALPVELSLDPETCGTTTLAEVPLHSDCGGTVEVLLTDQDNPGRLFGSQCVDLPSQGANTVADLPSLLAPNFKATAPDGATVSLEMQVHSSPLARTCADAPRRLITDVPVLSGESPPVTLGDEEARLAVTLSCPSEPRSCRVVPVVDDTVSVSAGVRDFQTLAPLDNTLELDVSFGFIAAGAPSHWQLAGELIYEGELSWTTPHRFVLPDPLPGGCYGTRVNWTNEETLMTSSFFSCEGTRSAQNLTISGWYADPDLIDGVVKAFDFQRVPPGGLLIGRVLDDQGLPLAGAVVRADGVDVVVRYLSAESPMTPQEGATSANGLFTVTSWPTGNDTCCSSFTARTSERQGRSAAPLGLVKGVVTVATIVTSLSPL